MDIFFIFFFLFFLLRWLLQKDIFVFSFYLCIMLDFDTQDFIGVFYFIDLHWPLCTCVLKSPCFAVPNVWNKAVFTPRDKSTNKKLNRMCLISYTVTEAVCVLKHQSGFTCQHFYLPIRKLKMSWLFKLLTRCIYMSMAADTTNVQIRNLTEGLRL